MYRKSYCNTQGIQVHSCVNGISKMEKFYIKVFYVMGKTLPGKAIMYTDRSCFFLFFLEGARNNIPDLSSETHLEMSQATCTFGIILSSARRYT